VDYLEPDFKHFRVVLAQPAAAQLFVPIVFSIGPAGQPAQDALFFMNQTLVKVGDRWTVASILPIPVPLSTPPQNK